MGELARLVTQQLGARKVEDQDVPAEAQKRMAEALSVQITELATTKRARVGAAEGDGQAPGGAAPSSAPAQAPPLVVQPRWQPDELSVEQLREKMASFEVPGEGDDALRERARAMAKGGFAPY